MSIPDCQNQHMVDCGTAIATLATETGYEMSHSKRRTVSLSAGAIALTIQQRSRTFDYTDKDRHDHDSAFKYVVMLSDGSIGSGTYDCYIDNRTFTADLAEFYRCVDTEILYLDLRNDIIIFREVVEVMDLSQSSSDIARFHTAWGELDLHKFIIVDPMINVTERVVMQKGGAETVIYSATYQRGYGDDLRLAMPGQPSGAEPFDPTFDFYRTVDHQEADGGQDLYWPDWLKVMGRLNQEMDQDERTSRQDFYNSGIYNVPVRVGAPISMPEIVENPFPFGSVAVNRDGYMFMSALFDMGDYISPVLVTKLYDPDGNEIPLDTILYSGNDALPEGPCVLFPIMLA